MIEATNATSINQQDLKNLAVEKKATWNGHTVIHVAHFTLDYIIPPALLVFSPQAIAIYTIAIGALFAAKTALFLGIASLHYKLDTGINVPFTTFASTQYKFALEEFIQGIPYPLRLGLTWTAMQLAPAPNLVAGGIVYSVGLLAEKVAYRVLRNQNNLPNKEN